MSDGESSSDRPPAPARGFEAFKAHALANKIEVALWALRIVTVLFCLGYFLPLFGNASNAYYKALLANAAVSALRLHQRLPRVNLSREFLSQLISEDSCHYIVYSLIFVYAAPIALVVVPIELYALLHAASYSLPLLDTLGQNSCWFARLLISLVELQSRNILRLIALTEILLMPYCIFMVFAGGVGLPTPFVYYHFLTLRYSSRRNPYTRNMFAELRERTVSVANYTWMPAIFRTVLLKGIDVTSRLAPVPQPQSAQ